MYRKYNTLILETFLESLRYLSQVFLRNHQYNRYKPFEDVINKQK